MTSNRKNASTSCCSHESVSNSDINEISVESQHLTEKVGLKYLPSWPAVNLEFRDLNYSVPDLTKGSKLILRGIHGEFRSNELTAVLGPSGCGKTTLLNVLAGYNSSTATGQINVNRRPRQAKIFRRMSRYIMQNEVLDPHCTVQEAMILAAHLKLGNELPMSQKMEMIDEILYMLRLKKSENTMCERMSGGEKKRLSIALELVNNPPVIFLDEPTTGLDDLSSSQCISLLRRIAHSGRTIICTIHTPSAKLFDMFDKVYVLADGQCAYQGSTQNIVPFMNSIGLSCPLTYNPADFIIEVAGREYGNDYYDKMVAAVENGKCSRWTPDFDYNNTTISDTHEQAKSMEEFEEEINPKLLKSKCSWLLQFRLLLRRMLIQMWRDKSYIKLKFIVTIALGMIVGGIYDGVGNDATKALFNFGFAFTIIIAYLYLPMMPVLLQFPTEVRLLKREYFNQWYQLSSYYLAMVCSKIPFMLILAMIYITMIYLMSNQPLELNRFSMIFLISILTGMTSDSLGVLISSRFSIVNSMFVGPVISVPMILLSCYGIGYGKETYVPAYLKFFMSMSYLRHGLEGLVAALYGSDRSDTICPETEIFCMFKKSKFLLVMLGFDGVDYTYSVSCLAIFYVVFTLAAFIMIKQRLTFNSSNYIAVQYIGQFVKSHLNFASLKY
ncbi:ATP-binding cassette sub-family G member 1 [Episyrphus balteatus]|uniref:ATP-binding cassette sub-family G member 1 n=1 Tax=Episyrphus balteatus TaxID=286459 RepID=UPI002486CDB4|nr:ATP-binding cassette sub-family G member 1 [Episyrphus balteatus]XP_055839204.1 ATP-binding cassette sub-family G member 1 [Episyrphus balteatus]